MRKRVVRPSVAQHFYFLSANDFAVKQINHSLARRACSANPFVEQYRTEAVGCYKAASLLLKFEAIWNQLITGPAEEF